MTMPRSVTGRTRCPNFDKRMYPTLPTKHHSHHAMQHRNDDNHNENLSMDPGIDPAGQLRNGSSEDYFDIDQQRDYYNVEPYMEVEPPENINRGDFSNEIPNYSTEELDSLDQTQCIISSSSMSSEPKTTILNKYALWTEVVVFGSKSGQFDMNFPLPSFLFSCKMTSM